MKFLFDCTDEVCLPIAYHLAEDIKAFAEKMKTVEVDEKDTNIQKMKIILEAMMVKFPKETGELMSKLWVLDDGETAPNTFKTISAIFTNETAIDFFTSVLPSLLQIRGVLSSALKQKN